MTKTNTKTTDPQGELLTLVNEKNEVIGSIQRGRAHKKLDAIYRTIYVLIIDQNDNVLIQKRSPTKDLYPNCWDLSVGGHVNFGHGYKDTAVREIEEELGLKVNPKDLFSKGQVLVRLPGPGEYFEVFEYRLKEGESIKPLKEEISNTKWMSMADIKQSMKQKTLKWYARPLQTIEALY